MGNADHLPSRLSVSSIGRNRYRRTKENRIMEFISGSIRGSFSPGQSICDGCNSRKNSQLEPYPYYCG